MKSRLTLATAVLVLLAACATPATSPPAIGTGAVQEAAFNIGDEPIRYTVSANSVSAVAQHGGKAIPCTGPSINALLQQLRAAGCPPRDPAAVRKVLTQVQEKVRAF